MKQIIQNLKNGETILADVPVPKPGPGEVLIKTEKTLVSLGTERMLVDFSKAGYLEKARQQPDKVKMVLDKVKTDGLKPTIDSVRNKLNQPLPLGYSNYGRVLEIGAGVTRLQTGDRVISNGYHAEYVTVSENLTAIVPDEVAGEEAAFTVVAAIGLQGIRLIAPTYGETIVVYGLGLIGLISVQLLTGNGCRVLGIDMDEDKVKLAEKFGAVGMLAKKGSDLVGQVMKLTGEVGADGVVITASAKSDELIANSARMCRQRGRVVLVGVIGLNLSRADFYEKELTFQVSCSYGPGRYDPNYEEKGNDYPIGFVRWTEKRNFEAILQGLQRQQLDFKPLISETVQLDHFSQIYGAMSRKNIIASILEYPEAEPELRRSVNVTTAPASDEGGKVAIIGAGNFTSATVLPAITEKDRRRIKYIVSSKGLTATTLAGKYGISHAATDYDEVLKDPEVGLVILTTRHHLHARQVILALAAGKSVFVEKPLAISSEELSDIRQQYEKSLSSGAAVSLMVGYNRRFSPYIRPAKELLSREQGPITITATMNAGAIPPTSWVQDMEQGGGRIIGEACHYIDLAIHLTGSLVTGVHMSGLGISPASNVDTAVISLKHANGSISNINYFANGHKSYPKEEIRIFTGSGIIAVDNFKAAKFYGYGRKNISGKQDKGHREQFRSLLAAENMPLIPVDELFNGAEAAIKALEAMRSASEIRINR
jgi:predicted dehydrogenase/threonine dehydrogenase-like Zn-dependent dehydrogenase